MPGGGDAIGSGFLYNGKALPALRGKYIFTDISTGRIWYADYKEMLAADDGNPRRWWRRQEVKLLWDKKHVYDTMFPIVESAYHSRGGKIAKLPGTGARLRRRAARTPTSRSTPPASSTSSPRPTA